MTEAKETYRDIGELPNLKDARPTPNGEDCSTILPDQQVSEQQIDNLEIFKAAIAYHTALHNEILRYRAIFFSALVISFTIPLAILSKKIEFCFINPVFIGLSIFTLVLWAIGIVLMLRGMKKSLLFKKWEPEKRVAELRIALDLCKGRSEFAVRGLEKLFQTDCIFLTAADESRRLFAWAIVFFLIVVFILLAMYLFVLGGFTSLP